MLPIAHITATDGNNEFCAYLYPSGECRIPMDMWADEDPIRYASLEEMLAATGSRLVAYTGLEH